MFPKLVKAYKDFGYQLHIGNNNCLCASLTQPNGLLAHTGGGIGITDIAFFFGLSTIFRPNNILAVGNAAGYGSFCLAEIFQNSSIDIIDAEVEGEFNKTGSELTKNISNKYYNGRVKLSIGFCPEDLDKFYLNNKYDLIFLDSLHTNEQQLKDYTALVNYANDNCIMYLHDVDLLNMQDSYNVIKQNSDGFIAYNVDFTSFGCKALVRNNNVVEEWFKLIDTSPNIAHQNPAATLRASIVEQPSEIKCV